MSLQRLSKGYIGHNVCNCNRRTQDTTWFIKTGPDYQK